MKNVLFFKTAFIAFTILFVQFSYAQLADGFDIKAAYQQAKGKGVASNILDEYVNHQHALYLKSKTINQQIIDLGTIYKSYNSNSSIFKPGNPNLPQNAYCPNAGFEQGNFGNWVGETGDVTDGATTAPYPVYTQTGSVIVNPSGNNTSIINPNNFHTILTTPATNSVYPNCVGWDSIACKVIGTQTVSEIPWVNPTGGPASVRLNGIHGFDQSFASKLTYNMTLNPNNKNFSISYALVLENGTHPGYQQPYFSVKVRDQNGTLVPGCSVYTVTCDANLTNTASALYDPSWSNSVITFDAMYRKWSTYAFDFSNYPTITSVSVEFYVGGCSLGGHFGYAYVDAECSQGGAVASFCAGSNTTVLTAPAGYNSYQWTGPSGPVSSANGGNTGTATITPVTAGQVFTCNVTAANGCSSIFQTTVSITTVSITGINSTPSCPNGNSGTTSVAATGSSSGYSYQWLNSLGTTVGNSQTASGLSPGTYSVIVSSALCGSATETVAVGISAPTFYSLPAPYCGTVAWINGGAGSNYKWYTASPLALIPGATSSSLTVNSPVNGASYFLVYTTASGCKDSINYILSQSPGGNIYVSNIKSICAGNNNSYAVINLQTTASPVYSYTVTGPSGYNSVLNNTNAIKDSAVGLSIGTYSATVFDGQCLYNTTFTVSPFIYSYTLTPQNTSICNAGSTTLTVNFGNTTPSTCGLSSSGSCTSPNLITIGNGTSVNSTTSYPAIYSNWFKNARHQILYLASELSAAGVLPGKISSIAFNITSIAGTTTYPNFSIKMKCTNVNDLGVGTAFDGVGLTQVFFAANANITVGWNTYSFPTAYEWDGVSNLLIDVCSDLTASYTNNSSSPYTPTAFNSVRWFNSDVTPACSNASSSGYTPNSTYRPNIKFGNCGGSNPAAFSYTWTPTTSLNPTNTYTTIANPTVTTVYTVQVNPIGQTNCMQAKSSTITVTSAVAPTITPVSALCSNAASFSLTATPAGGTWSLTPATSTIGVFTPSLASVGNNTVTYLYGGVGCAQTATTTIPIEQFVPATITGTINPICLPSNTVNLSTAVTTSTLGAGVWSGNGVTGTTFNPITAGVGTHTLSYNTNSSPTTPLCPASSSIAVQVNSATQPTITTVNPLCSNAASFSLTVNPTGGTWTGSGISATGLFTPSLATVGNNTYTYVVGSSTCSAVNTTTISVEQYVPATLTNPAGPYCVYDAATNLQTIAQFAGGVWSGPGVTGTIFNPSAAGVGVHVVNYNTNSTPTNCGSISTISITVNPKPEANAFPNITSGCNPITVSYATSSYPTGLAVWNFGDGTAVDTGLVVNHMYLVPGTYTATLYYTDAIGCRDTTIATSAITSNPLPIASFEPSVIETTVVDGQVEFTNQSTILSNNSYTWDIGGIYNSVNVNESFLFVNSGNFVVTLIATTPEGCMDDTSVVIVVNPDVVLYVPNAFTPGTDGLNDVFQIFLPPTGVDYSTFNLVIYDRWGEIVYKTTDVNQSWTGAKNNAGEVLKQDVYVYKINFKDEKKKNYQRVGHVSLLHK